MLTGQFELGHSPLRILVTHTHTHTRTVIDELFALEKYIRRIILPQCFNCRSKAEGAGAVKREVSACNAAICPVVVYHR